MPQIAFLLLVHRDPQDVIAQVRTLTSCGDHVAVHYDARAPRSEWLALLEGLAGLPRVHVVRNRLRGGWGQWSLVAATLRLMQLALDQAPDASYFYLISGDCRPIKSAAELRDFLDKANQDHIESVDFFRSDWIKTGMKTDRLIYRHMFNERSQRRRFYLSLWLQRIFRLRRRLPVGIGMRIGSQWWCLRRDTVGRVLEFCQMRPDVVRFFRKAWIPDEVFFQTVVHHLVPEKEVSRQPLTRLLFSDYGMPVTFHEDQVDMLLSQRGFFVRKVAHGAFGLRKMLDARFQGTAEPGTAQHPDLADSYRWLARTGRIGARAPQPPWAHPPPDVTVIICKKWDISQRVARKSVTDSGHTFIGSVFDELADTDPDLGGYGRRLDQRSAAPMAYLSRVAEAADARHVLVCVDPCHIDLIQSLHRSGARVLRLDCALDPDFVAAHSRRLGLGDQLCAAVRSEIDAELRALDQLGPTAVVIEPSLGPRVAARRLAHALDIGDALAKEIGAEFELTGG